MIIPIILLFATTSIVKPALPPDPELPRLCRVVTEDRIGDWMQYVDAFREAEGWTLLGMTAKVECWAEIEWPMLRAERILPRADFQVWIDRDFEIRLWWATRNRLQVGDYYFFEDRPNVCVDLAWKFVPMDC